MYCCVKLLQRRDGEFNPLWEEGHSNPTSSKVSKQSLQDLTGTDVTVCEHTLSAVHFLTRRVYITCLSHGGISVHDASAATSLSWVHACRPYFPDQQTAGVRVFMLLATFQDNFEIIHTPVVCWWLIKKIPKKKNPCICIEYNVKTIPVSELSFIRKTIVWMCEDRERKQWCTHRHACCFWMTHILRPALSHLCSLWLWHIGCCNVIFASVGHMCTTETVAYYT